MQCSTAQLVLLQNPKAPSQKQNGSTKSGNPRASQHDLGWKAKRRTSLLPVAGDVFTIDFPFYRTRKMTDEELVRFGKEVRRLAENPFQRQLEEAGREWKQRKNYRIREQK